MYRGLPRDGFERAVLKNTTRHCPRCGAPLRFAYRRRRRLILLREWLALDVDCDRCRDPACPLATGFSPPEEARLALPKFTYGLDVLTELARLRWTAHQTVPEIHATLRARYDLPLSERNVEYLLEVWQDLATAWMLRDRHRRHALRQQGGIILAIDGLQPEKGHDTLYLLRDTLSQTTLLTRALGNSSSAHLVALINEVKAMGVPILGVVTDKQHSLLLAVAKALPGVPHQLCQFHFLRNLAQPVMEADRTMKKGIKQRLRGLAGVERRLRTGPPPAAEPHAVALEQATAYCVAVRATLNDDGNPPLDPGGVKMVARLRALDRSLAQSEKKGAVGTPSPARDRAGRPASPTAGDARAPGLRGHSRARAPLAGGGRLRRGRGRGRRRVGPGLGRRPAGPGPTAGLAGPLSKNARGAPGPLVHVL